MARGKRCRTVILTRPQGQADALAAALRRLGARPVLAPAIRIAPPLSWQGLDQSLRRLDRFDAAVFTSVNGVLHFFRRAEHVLGTRPRLPRRLFAIGPATASALARRGHRGASIPERFEGEALALHLIRRLGDARCSRVLLPRAREARDVLPRLLTQAGVAVTVVEAYRTLPDRAGCARLKRAVTRNGDPIVTFTSPSTVREFVSAVGLKCSRRFFRKAAAASIGPITSAALRRHGIEPAAEARTYTVAGLARALAPLLR